MKKLLLILLLPFTAWAQTNLVPNPSFEDTATIRDFVLFPVNAPPWYRATACGSSDYFNEDYGTAPNTFAGYSEARTGKSFCGLAASAFTFMPDDREYLQVKLSQPLIAGETYLVGYYYSIAADASYSIVANMGFRFSFDTLSYPSWFSSPPLQAYCYYLGTGANALSYIDTSSALLTSLNEGGDTTAWYPLQTIYTAVGGEEFLTIGNLYGADSTALVYLSTPNIPSSQDLCYYFIDDVFVIPLEDPTTYNCLNNACIDPLDGTGLYDSLATCQAVCNATAIEENNTTKQLLKITDVLGRESKPKPNVPLFYRYDDGTVEKKIVIE